MSNGEAGATVGRFWPPSGRGLPGWTHAALVVVALFLLEYYWWSPKLPFNGGFGWDGVNYARWVISLPQEVLEGSLSSYHIKRILPSFLVSLPARVLALPVTREYIIGGFCVGNALCTYLAALFWLRLCAALKMSGPRALLGLVLLIANYPVLKQAAYYSVLTDLFALASATAMLDCWVRDRRLGLAIAVLVSMFCWASTPVLGSLLLLFPRGSTFRLGRWSRFAPGIGWLAGLAYALGASVVGTGLLSKDPMPVPVWRGCLPVSILVAGAYVFFVARTFGTTVSGGEGSPRLAGLSWARTAAWLLLVPGVVLVQHLVAPQIFVGALDLPGLVIGSINRPGLFLVGDFTYYGTIMVLGALFLPAVLREAGRLGLGVLGATVFGLGLNLYPETRMSMNVLPFFVLPLILALPGGGVNGSQWLFVGLCQFATSKIWLPIEATAEDFLHSWQDYPVQYLFASHAPWMANDAFVVQGVLAVVALVVAGLLFRPGEFRGR